MQKSLYSKANISKASHEISRILYNPNFHFHDHNSQPIVSVLNQINPLDAIPNEVNYILILCSHLSIGFFFREVSFHQASHQTPRLHTCYIPCLSLRHITPT
jgi:hypothetical protein